MSAHTPGPWRTDPEVDDQSVIGPDGFMLADCAIFSLQDGAPSSERCTANARLIAAAPDLLAELVAHHDCEWMVPHEDLPSHKGGQFPDECSGCAAIAKARGGRA